MQALKLRLANKAASQHKDVPSPQPSEHDEKGASTPGEDEKDVELSPVSLTVETEVPSENVQEGVRRVEAITQSWSKKALITIYANMWLIYCTNGFQSSITGNLTPYVTSGFDQHSLIPVISIVVSVMSAAVYLPVAKMLDLWGRPEGFTIMMALATVGTIMMATTTNITTYCAAQVFYSVGYGGMIYCVDVLTADTSSLRNRGLAFAFTSSPYFISALGGPKAAESFLEHVNWRWGFGMFAIILPCVAAPLIFTLQRYQRKAKKAGLLVRPSIPATGAAQVVLYYLKEFDVLGVFLFAAGLSLFLLPFSIAESAANRWKSAHIIAMIVIGIVLLIAFGIFERFVSPKPFLNGRLLLSRSILGTVGLAATYQIAYYCWYSYFTSFLQVVNNLTVSQAGYVSGVFDMISSVWLLFIGYLIRRLGYFKYILVAGVSLYLLAISLMIHFRRPHTHIGYIIMCQIFMAFGGSTIILCEQVSVMAAVDHQHIAAALALLSVCGWIGGSIGSAISGAIWTNSFPTALAQLLPPGSIDMLDSIYGDLTVQLSYPVEDPTRDAIIAAYGVGQKRMLIAGSCFSALALGWTFLIKNIKVDKQQTKGTLF